MRIFDGGLPFYGLGVFFYTPSLSHGWVVGVQVWTWMVHLEWGSYKSTK